MRVVRRDPVSFGRVAGRPVLWENLGEGLEVSGAVIDVVRSATAEVVARTGAEEPRMSQDVRIDATTRDHYGKGASRQYRRDGQVPAVVYGSGSEVRHVVLPGHELSLALRIPRVVLNVELDGDTLLVAPRDVQKDPVRQSFLHVDLIMLSKADVEARHAYADALAKAEQLAEEAGHDPIQAAAIIEEAAANEENLDEVAGRIVELLEEQARARAEAAAAAAAKEDAAAEAAAAEGEAAEGDAESGGGSEGDEE